MNLLDSIVIVSETLDQIGVFHAFLGGSVIPLLVDDPALYDFRPTKDVDAIVQIVTQAKYSTLESQLRAFGFLNDMTPGAPICRYIYRESVVDVMPIDPSVIGFAFRWLPEALNTSVETKVGTSKKVRIISPGCFLATKLDAFRSRGRNDCLGSHDLEDLVMVIDGCSKIGSHVQATSQEMRSYIVGEFRNLVSQRAFLESLDGHVSEFERAEIVLARIRGIIGS